MYFFSEDVLLERLFNFLSEERPDAMATCVAAMQHTMVGGADATVCESEDVDDYRYWFWDDTADMWTFDIDRALHFFGYLGFIHPDHLPASPPLASRIATMESALAAEHDRMERLQKKISRMLVVGGDVGGEKEAEPVVDLEQASHRETVRSQTWTRGNGSAPAVPIGHTLFSWLPSQARHRRSRRRWPSSMSPPLGHTPSSWGLISGEELRALHSTGAPSF